MNVQKTKQEHKPQNNYSLDPAFVNSVLHEDDVVGSYRTMCKILFQPEQAGNSRKAQTKEWLRYFDYHREGNRFVIDEVYDAPLLKPISKRAVYIDLIALQLCDMLSKRDGRMYTATTQQLFTDLNMVGSFYSNGYRNARVGSRTYDKDGKEVLKLHAPVEYQGEYEIDPYLVRAFFDDTNLYLNKILTSALNSLENNWKLIYHTKAVCVIEEIDGRRVERFADDDEATAFVDLEQAILRQMNCVNMADVVFKNRQREFYRKVDASANEVFGWTKVYHVHKIGYTQNSMAYRLDDLRNKVVVDSGNPGKELNDRVVSHYLQSLTRRYRLPSAKVCEEDDDWGKPSFEAASKQAKGKTYSQLAEMFIPVRESGSSGIVKFIGTTNSELKFE